MHVIFIWRELIGKLVIELELNCTCGAGPMQLLISRTDRNHMRRFYNCPLNKVCVSFNFKVIFVDSFEKLR
jgi:hypothetical protein